MIPSAGTGGRNAASTQLRPGSGRRWPADLSERFDEAGAELAIAQTDHIIRILDEMRAEMGISKAELARQIDRNASSIRRLSPRTTPSQSSRSSPRSPRRSGFA